MKRGHELPVLLSRVLKGGLELGLVTAAFAFAHLLRFDFEPSPEEAGRFWAALPLAVLSKGVALWWFGLFGTWWWRYVGIPDLVRMAGAVALASVGTTATTLAVVPGFPRSVLLLDAMLSALLLGGVVAASRVFREWGAVSESRRAGRRVLVVGAGEAGVRLLREVRRDPRLGVRPLGFVDDDPEKRGGWVQGLRVLGTRADVPALVAQLRVEEIVIAIPSAGRREIREIFDVCKAAGVPVRIVPPTRDILAGDPEHLRLRHVQIEDLLGRPPVRFEHGPIETALRGRRILVTGAGGSIGSELARQIATCRPATLVLLDRYEHTLYYLERELRERCPDVPVVPCIADVTDRLRMASIIGAHTPEVILHAAAHKHVPLMEQHPGEAVRNNVGGTRTVAELAQEHGVERFVLISTDKAIRPSSVMGCSKRVAELTLQAMQPRGRTRFITVRFGNVLGSEGSVVPLFWRQIARGGPVTITHPDVVRYFMLIPEAVRLVLHAGVLGRGGEIFFLDMGEPVRVLDLAIDMIRLAGFRPYEDIDIRFTGLRPGEKVAEELWSATEHLAPASHPGLHVLQNGAPPAWDALVPGLRELERSAWRHDGAGVRAWLKRLVPEYAGVRPADVAIAVEADEDETRIVVSRSA